MDRRERLNSQEWSIRFEREREERERARRAEQEELLDGVAELLERHEIDPRSASLERLRRALKALGRDPVDASRLRHADAP